MTPEGKVKAQVKKVLDLYKPDLYYEMPVPGGYGKPTLDFIGWFKGQAFAIETKREGKKPTPRQDGTREDMMRAGGIVFVIIGMDHTGTLEQWLKVRNEVIGDAR